jgi:hypothetical protein
VFQLVKLRLKTKILTVKNFDTLFTKKFYVAQILKLVEFKFMQLYCEGVSVEVFQIVELRLNFFVEKSG